MIVWCAGLRLLSWIGNNTERGKICGRRRGYPRRCVYIDAPAEPLVRAVRSGPVVTVTVLLIFAGCKLVAA